MSTVTLIPGCSIFFLSTDVIKSFYHRKKFQKQTFRTGILTMVNSFNLVDKTIILLRSPNSNVLPWAFVGVSVAWCFISYCAFHKHANSKVQKPPSQLRFSLPSIIREFKIPRLRTKTTLKHNQSHVTVHFSRVVLRLRWVVELFRVVATRENILLAFYCFGNSRISSFLKKNFQFTCFKWEGSKICKFCLISAQIYAFNPLLWLHFYLAKLIFK